MTAIRCDKLKALFFVFTGLVIFSLLSASFVSEIQLEKSSDRPWVVAAVEADNNECTLLASAELDTFIVSVGIVTSWFSSLKLASSVPVTECVPPCTNPLTTASPRSPPSSLA